MANDPEKLLKELKKDVTTTDSENQKQQKEILRKFDSGE